LLDLVGPQKETPRHGEASGGEGGEASGGGGDVAVKRAWCRAAIGFLASLPRAMKIVLALATVLHGIGLFWGLPSSDAWDNDGIAPRDILPGLASTFTPGDFYTYPPVHLALLAVLTLPVTIVAVVRAPSMSVPAVVKEILAPGYMTAFAATARIVSLLMSLGIAIAVAKIAEEIFFAEEDHQKDDSARAERVGVFSAAIVSAGICVTYYAHMSNLDIPALFWGSIGALFLVRAVRRNEPRLIRWAAIFAVLAIGSKDQAYALFLVSAPLMLGAWLVVDHQWGRQRANRRMVFREVAISALIGALLLALVDGAITNPSGFRARLTFLRGPASQDFSGYASDVEGRFALLADLGRRLTIHYPMIFGALIAVGFVLCLVQSKSRRSQLMRLAPFLFALSFTIGFNLAARRTDDRFTLPQAVFMAIYAAYGMEWLWSRFATGAPMVVMRTVCAGLLVVEVWEALRVDLTLLFEPRIRTEAFLAANVRPEDTIEVHGLNVYLPRFPPNAHVVRVGQNRRRGPLPGVEEVEAPLMELEKRSPRWVVISMCFAWRFLEKNTGAHEGRIYPESQLREAHDADATMFFDGMYAQKLGYKIVDDQKIPQDGYGWFRPIEIHASLNCRTTTWERN
jgi:hypothetical protein